MKVISIILSIILFSGILGVSDSFGQECKQEHVLIFKVSKNTPACVKPTTAEQLMERGWGMMPEEPFTNYPDSCQVEPDPGLCRAAFVKYYFNSETTSCEQFIWGGCGGLVPFDSLSDCQVQCGSTLESEYSIRTGVWAGMCFGSCATYIAITPEKVIFSEKNWGLDELPPEGATEGPVSKHDWQELVDLINFPNFILLPDNVGCPGCADAPVHWIEISNSTLTKKVSFESKDNIREITDLRNEIEKIIQKTKTLHEEKLKTVEIQLEFQKIDSKFEKFNVDAGERGIFSVPYKIEGAELKDIFLDYETQGLTIKTTNSTKGELSILVDRELIDTVILDDDGNSIGDDEFFILVNDEEVDFEETKNSERRFFVFSFWEGTNTIEFRVTSHG